MRDRKITTNVVAWEDDEDVVTINGAPEGHTIARRGRREAMEAAAIVADYANKEIAALEAEVAALKARLDDVLLKDRGKTREINILTRENRSLAAEIAALKGTLESLLDVQNGPPLEKYRDEWQRAVDDASRLLGRTGGGEG